jgi:hypothetical protein
LLPSCFVVAKIERLTMHDMIFGKYTNSQLRLRPVSPDPFYCIFFYENNAIMRVPVDIHIYIYTVHVLLLVYYQKLA